MQKIDNIDNHKAFTCKCGSVSFNMLKSMTIECSSCGFRFGWWSEDDKKDNERRIKALTIISVAQHTDPLEGQKWCQGIANAALLGEKHEDLPL